MLDQASFLMIQSQSRPVQEQKDMATLLGTFTENIEDQQNRNSSQDNDSQQTFVGFEDVFKTSSTRLQRNNFTSSKASWRRLEDMYWRCLYDMSWRRLEDIMKTRQSTSRVYLYLTNLDVYLANPYFTNPYLSILRRIQNASITTHNFNIWRILELKQHLYFKN